MKNLVKKMKIKIIKGKIIDVIDYFRYVIAILLGLAMLFLYNNKFMLSIRGAISDTISFSSIVLGILGLLIGLLISLKDDSFFFKQAKKYDLKDEIYKVLMVRLRNAFMFNLALLLLSVIYCFVIPNINFWLKSSGLIIWFFLFLIVSWDTIFLIWIIVKICIFEPEENSTRGSKS